MSNVLRSSTVIQGLGVGIPEGVIHQAERGAFYPGPLCGTFTRRLRDEWDGNRIRSPWIYVPLSTPRYPLRAGGWQYEAPFLATEMTCLKCAAILCEKWPPKKRRPKRQKMAPCLEVGEWRVCGNGDIERILTLKGKMRHGGRILAPRGC